MEKHPAQNLYTKSSVGSVASQKMQNEPNLRRRGPVADPKIRNEPNFRTAGVSPAFPHPDYAKRPQSPYGRFANRPYNAKRTQSQQANHKPLRHKHLGPPSHKPLPGKYLGGRGGQTTPEKFTCDIACAITIERSGKQGDSSCLRALCTENIALRPGSPSGPKPPVGPPR